jgi:hypothetical protein
MNRNYRGGDDDRRNEGRWEPRMNRFGGERDWNERAFGEDFNERRDFEESGRYGQDDRFGGRNMMERDRFGGERNYGYGYGQRGMYGGGMYGGERGYGGFGFGGERGYGGEWGNERGMYRGQSGQWGGQQYGREPGLMERVRRFFGKGPKGYQRSDERIKEDICDRLAQHEWLDSSEVEVQVQSGEVTLTGTVEDRHSKRMLEDIAEDVFGVKDVHNQTRVDMNLRERGEQQTQQSRTTTKTPKA